jgi:methanogenic corrinoid protein MtbC1
MRRAAVTAGPQQPADVLLDRVAKGDGAAALQHARALLDEGIAPDDLVAALADVQREVGRRWQANEWSVAQEHAATAIVDRVLAAVAARIAEPSVYPPVLVVCAGGEWHTMGPRMLADQLRWRRWDARFLGGSLPAEHLAEHLALERPFALAVSCTLPTSLPGAQETIAAGHRGGVPVLVGGRALTARRAAALGADAWAPDAEGAVRELARWWTDGPPRLASADPDAVIRHRRLRSARPAVVDRAEQHLLERLPWLVTATEVQRRRTREDLAYLAAFTESAVLTRDRSLLDDYLPWLAEVLDSRGVPLAVIAPTLTSFAAALRSAGEEETAALLAAVQETFAAA